MLQIIKFDWSESKLLDCLLGLQDWLTTQHEILNIRSKFIFKKYIYLLNCFFTDIYKTLNFYFYMILNFFLI